MTQQITPELQQSVGYYVLLGLGIAGTVTITQLVGYYFKRKFDSGQFQKLVCPISGDAADLIKVVKGINGKLDKVDGIHEALIRHEEQSKNNASLIERTGKDTLRAIEKMGEANIKAIEKLETTISQMRSR